MNSTGSRWPLTNEKTFSIRHSLHLVIRHKNGTDKETKNSDKYSIFCYCPVLNISMFSEPNCEGLTWQFLRSGSGSSQFLSLFLFFLFSFFFFVRPAEGIQACSGRLYPRCNGVGEEPARVTTRRLWQNQVKRIEGIEHRVISIVRGDFHSRTEPSQGLTFNLRANVAALVRMKFISWALRVVFRDNE